MKILFDTTIALYHKNIAFVNTDVNKKRGHSMIADPFFTCMWDCVWLHAVTLSLV